MTIYLIRIRKTEIIIHTTETQHDEMPQLWWSVQYGTYLWKDRYL